MLGWCCDELGDDDVDLDCCSAWDFVSASLGLLAAHYSDVWISMIDSTCLKSAKLLFDSSKTLNRLSCEVAPLLLVF